MQNKYVIKRYGNRKLYDTVAHAYIGLNDVYNLFASGKDLFVYDHNKKDITNFTIFTAIVEIKGKEPSFLDKLVAFTKQEVAAERSVNELSVNL